MAEIQIKQPAGREESEIEKLPKDTETEDMEGKRLFAPEFFKGRNIPVHLLDGLILGLLLTVVLLVIISSVNGGYTISFDTDGGTDTVSQKLHYGMLIEEPEVPQKPGYTFAGWKTSLDESLAEEWDFSEDSVEGDLTLYAVWVPAEITVKFDLAGGNWGGKEVIPDMQILFGEAYGALPVPVKEGYQFDGWIYSGNIISSDTLVGTSGEHVLTARWLLQ